MVHLLKPVHGFDVCTVKRIHAAQLLMVRCWADSLDDRVREVPEMIATELGNYLVHSPEGVPLLKRMIVEDIEAARRRGNLKHALQLRMVLHHFVQTHPENPAKNGAEGEDTMEASK